MPHFLSLLSTSRQRRGRDTRSGGARPEPGQTQHAGFLFPTSRCLAWPSSTATGAATSAQAVRGQSWARLDVEGP